jgi:hypothetical protein
MARLRNDTKIEDRLIEEISGDYTIFQGEDNPTITTSGVSSADENNVVSVYITDYNVENTYNVVGEGSYSRNGNVISWRVPSVSENTSKTITVQLGTVGSLWSEGSSVSVLVNATSIDTPTHTSPTNGQSDIELNHTFEFSDYSDDNTEWSHVSTQIQIDEVAGDFSSPVLDETKTTGDLTEYQISEEDLDNGTSYKWRVRYKCNYNDWSEWSTATTFTTVAAFAATGLFLGGYGYRNNIDKITINTTGDATDFGDLSYANRYGCSTSNGTDERGITAIAYSVETADRNIIEYVTINSPGNATDFGDLTQGRYSFTATSNNTDDRGVFLGGYDGSIYNIIEYVTITNTGNATDFGDTRTDSRLNAATSNATDDRAIYMVSAHNTLQQYSNVIEYFTITSLGNSSDFGDVSSARESPAATSNNENDRALFMGGGNNFPSYVYFNTIEYVTITSTGNSTDFGDLTVTVAQGVATSDGTSERGVFGGGTNSSLLNVIQYVTINSTGDATDFGDLTAAIRAPSATSDA